MFDYRFCGLSQAFSIITLVQFVGQTSIRFLYLLEMLLKVIMNLVHSVVPWWMSSNPKICYQ